MNTLIKSAQESAKVASNSQTNTNINTQGDNMKTLGKASIFGLRRNLQADLKDLWTKYHNDFVKGIISSHYRGNADVFDREIETLESKERFSDFVYKTLATDTEVLNKFLLGFLGEIGFVEFTEYYKKCGASTLDEHLLRYIFSQAMPRSFTKMIHAELEDPETFFLLAFKLADTFVKKNPYFSSSVEPIALICVFVIGMVSRASDPYLEWNNAAGPIARVEGPFHESLALRQAYKHVTKKSSEDKQIPKEILIELETQVMASGYKVRDNNLAELMFRELFDPVIVRKVCEDHEFLVSMQASNLLATGLAEAFKIPFIADYLRLYGIRKNNVQEFLSPIMRKAFPKAKSFIFGGVRKECLKLVASISIAVQLQLFMDNCKK